MTIDEFIARYENQYVDVDGFPADQKYQCWDLWSLYAQQVHGLTQAETITPTQYASGLWAGHVGQRAFDRVDASRTAQKGDVAIWAYGTTSFPSSHVAIVIADQGDTLLTLSQNPGPARRLTLTKQGLLGYLRPKTTEKGNDDMLTDDDIMRLWTHKLPNGRPARDIISDATSDIIRMHDSGITGGQWVHTLPNGRKARDIISDATSDIIRIHDTMIPQLAAQVKALAKQVELLQTALGTVQVSGNAE